jgi:anthranilate phosphoribosyltransferase
MVTSPHDILARLLAKGTLSEAESQGVFMRILSGESDPAHTAALLALIASRGPSVDELVGGARAMRAHVTRVQPPDGRGVLIDTCGTGGAPKTFNVSTVGAIITAAAGAGRVLVAKHGSVSKTGRGSAEVMQALGVNVAASAEVQARCLRELGVCFSFAMHHHPAMKHAAPVRKTLGFPTIFNLLGPLTNPAGATRQLIGTYSQSVAQKLAETLLRLGVDRAMVVTSEDGLDEITLTAPTTARLIENNVIHTFTIEPQHMHMPRCTLDDLQAESLEDSVAIFRSVLSGERDPKTDMALLNAGAALFVAGAAESVHQGVSAARDAVRSGQAASVLDGLVRVSNQG